MKLHTLHRGQVVLLWILSAGIMLAAVLYRSSINTQVLERANSRRGLEQDLATQISELRSTAALLRDSTIEAGMTFNRLRNTGMSAAGQAYFQRRMQALADRSADAASRADSLNLFLAGLRLRHITHGNNDEYRARWKRLLALAIAVVAVLLAGSVHWRWLSARRSPHSPA